MPGSLASNSAQTPGPGAKVVDAGRESLSSHQGDQALPVLTQSSKGFPAVMHCPLERPGEGREQFTGTGM